MKTFRRLTLLGSFAAVGVGLAIGIGSSAPKSDNALRPLPQSESWPASPSQSESKSGPAPSAGSAVPQREPANNPAARRAVAGPSLPVLSTGRSAADGSRWAGSYPAVAQQFVPPVGDEVLKQAAEFMQRQLAQPPSSAPTSATSAPPALIPSSAPPAPMPATPPGAGGGISQSATNQSSAAASPVGGRAVGKATIDEEGDGRLSMRIQDSELVEVLDLLSEQGNLNILASKNVQGKVSATLNGVDVGTALEAILRSTGYMAKRQGQFIFVGTKEDLDAMEQSMDKIGTRVYRPNYVSAAELQSLIQPLVAPTTGVVSVSSEAEVGIAADVTKAGGNSFAGGDVVVVRDYEAVLAQIDQMVGEIDVRPLQVAIEAMILSVKLKDGNQFGVNFELLRNEDHTKLGFGTIPEGTETKQFETIDTIKSAAVDGLTRVALNSGLKFGFLDQSMAVFLNALESIGDTNVIATPRVMVLNKQRAEIQIGAQKGYVSTTITETSTSQSVEFLDTGTVLRLRPFVANDGLVRMEIHPELSSGDVSVKDGFTLPNKEVTQVTTNVMVRDGCTVVIGGLIREELSTTTTQIPLLGSLPWIGAAFRNKTEATDRYEVLVLITPRIVYEPDTCREGSEAACEFHRRQAVYTDQMSPLIGKRSIGRRYFRLAQNAWAAGDRDTALRFVEMSIYFDPLSRAAIDLRSDIWMGQPNGEHALGSGVVATMSAESLDGQAVPDWLLNNLEHETPPTPPAPAPLHPLDRGQPGARIDLTQPRRLQ